MGKVANTVEHGFQAWVDRELTVHVLPHLEHFYNTYFVSAAEKTAFWIVVCVLVLGGGLLIKQLLIKSTQSLPKTVDDLWANVKDPFKKGKKGRVYCLTLPANH